MNSISVKKVPIKPRYILVYQGAELTYHWRSFGKAMCWKTLRYANKFLEENDFYIDRQKIDKNEIKIVELCGWSRSK